ncbi:MAG: hypothetical protein IT223_10485 [Crocinitomicaceae bacterium]|nr:hypothetical protein [Crocinitomicaceae bacterium]
MKHLLLFILFCFISITAMVAQKTDEDYIPDKQNAQPKTKPRFRDRLVLGGNLGGSFGTYTFLQIAPQVGYAVTDKWINGVGVNYMYYSAPGYIGETIYGGSLWTRYTIVGGLFTTATYEVLNRKVYDIPIGLHRRNVNVLLVGVGYYSGGNNGLGIGIQILYDLIGDPWSPYQNPLIRGGLLFGFN